MTRLFQIIFGILFLFIVSFVFAKSANAQITCSPWPSCCGTIPLQFCQPSGGGPPPPPPPPPPPVGCPGFGIPSFGWGGRCFSSGSQQKLACDGTSHCSVAQCNFYSGSTFCWFNSGTCYNDPAACNSVNPPPSCPQITCGGNPGAGGTCSFPSSPNVNVGSCSYFCSNIGQTVPGHTISVCQSNNCYANSCQCWPNSPCPSCPQITAGGNPGAGGTCSFPSSPNVNIGTCNYTCPGTARTVAGHTISVCQSNNCYANSNQCWPDSSTSCNNGQTKTVQQCNTSGTSWNTLSQTCVVNGTCNPITVTPTPAPGCNSCKSCNSCGIQCGTGSQTCSYNCYASGGNCQPVNFNQTCSAICPPGQSCVVNACIVNKTITGNIFVDTNKNTIKDGLETNYTGTITITSTGGSVTYPTTGAYTINNLATNSSYTISYTSLPTGYLMTIPLNGPPPSFTVSVGSPCSTGGSNSAACDGSGNISNLNFGINNLNPWIQVTGGDARIDNGFVSKITAGSTCGSFASLPGSGGTPGLIFSGNNSYDFGQGQASSTGWVVGGLTYPETYSPIQIGGQIKTSYNYLSAKATQGNITPVDISTYCTGGIVNCTLSGSLPHGTYKADGNLNLVGSSYTFGANQNYIILVNGDLKIAEKIFVPIGSTATFSTLGNINVDKSVGEATSTSTTSDLEGIYSAGKSFTVQGTNNCSITPDIRLNIAGTVITNAALGGGKFTNQRDLCASNSCPAFSVKDRPDFILNTPSFLKQANFTYQEVAP